MAIVNEPEDGVVFIDDVDNADWPKRTPDTHEAIAAGIEAEREEPEPEAS